VQPLVMFNAATDFRGGQQAAEQESQQSAQQGAPRIENAKVEARNVAGTLAATIGGGGEKRRRREWMGYSIKMVAGQRTICCGNYSDGGDVRCGKCELESGHDHSSNINSKKNTVGSAGNNKVKLEPGRS